MVAGGARRWADSATSWRPTYAGCPTGCAPCPRPGCGAGRPFPCRADAGRHAAPALATAAQAIEERAEHRPAGLAAVPRLADLAVGDQVAVTGHDLLAAAAAAQAKDEVATPDGRRPVAEVVGGAADLLATVRRLLLGLIGLFFFFF